VNSEESIVVDLSQLRIGLPLKYDLVTAKGAILAKAGDVVTLAMRNMWRADGIQLASAVVSTSTNVDSDNSLDIEPYNPIAIQRLEAAFHQASQQLLKSATKLTAGDFSGLKEVTPLVDRMRTDIADDIAAVLAVFAQSENQELSENDELIAFRSSKLSVLGLILAHQMDLSPDDQQSTALAGMFHDLALMDCVREGKGGRLYNAPYKNHPLESGLLLESAVGINAKVALAISQLHEQVDGTGFPKRLPQNRIITIARILNVADAYLTLTAHHQPTQFPQARSLHPADALGYLMYHAALGRFDRNVVRTLVAATSLYPVGSRVQLSDNSMAIVMRSTKDSPSKPIVRLEAKHAGIIDLRGANVAILKPATSALDHCTRISKSRIADVYWR
jgi:HD-GYP domain-containing protein (c-di-GMP phosphodiesterase class II)